MKNLRILTGLSLIGALVFTAGRISTANEDVGGHDPRTYKLMAHPHLPVTVYIPVSWDSRTSKRSKDEHNWILSPRPSERRETRPPNINLTITRLNGNTTPTPMLDDGYTNASFSFGGEGAGGRVIDNSELLADVEQENLHFSIRARAYTEEDKSIVQEVLRYIDVSAW